MTPTTMQTYITGDLNEDDLANAVTMPAEAVDPAAIVLADHRPGSTGSRASASERFLAIYRESGEEMDFTEVHKDCRPTRFQRIREWISARFWRWWVWNVSYPVKMWLHLRFYREKTLPDGRHALCAMLRDAFAANGVTDYDLPYPVKERPVDVKPSPGELCLFFNRKRVKGS